MITDIIVWHKARGRGGRIEAFVNTPQKSPSLLELIGGTAALLESVDLLVRTPPAALALAVVAWLLIRNTPKE